LAAPIKKVRELSTMSTPETTASRRVKPSIQTRFHIDYEWWERDELDLRLYLISHLSPERQAVFANNDPQAMGEVDWIDPDTAEVQRVDALQMALHEAALAEDFITQNTSLVDAVFRVFLSNNNQPLTPIDLGELLGHPPEKILRTVSGAQVYKGIRPYTD